MRTTKNGLTLVEMILSVVLLAMVIGAVTTVYLLGFRMFSEEIDRSDLYLAGSRLLERMQTELVGAKEIVSSGSDSISFWYRDLNGNGTREAEETIAYSLSSGKLVRAQAAIVIETGPVQSLQLSYDDPLDIKMISIKLEMGQDGAAATLESTVRPRNL